MMKSPGTYGLQLLPGQARDPVALRNVIRAKFLNTVIKDLTKHGLVSADDAANWFIRHDVSLPRGMT